MKLSFYKNGYNTYTQSFEVIFLHCVGATLTELVHFDNRGYPIQWFWMDLNLGNWYPTMTKNVYSKWWLLELGWDGKETNPFPWPGLRVVASQWIWWIADQLTTIAPLWVPIIDHCNWHRYQTTQPAKHRKSWISNC